MSAKKKRNVSVAVAVSAFGLSGAVHAGPSGGSVVAGTATITQAGLQTLIEQVTGKAVINWDDFSIGANEDVLFEHLTGSSAITLNRVTGDTVSQIKGALTANGNIFLINPNGILFGKDATVDVAGLLATTFDIADQDFMNGKFNFSGELMNGASITNQGRIEVGDGGFVYLIAPNVENTGHIIANVGRVALASDGSYDIDLTGNGLVTFSVTDADLSGAEGSISNGPGGTIEAGHVLLSGSEKDAVLSSVVNSGEIKAATSLTLSGSSVDNQAGTLELDVNSDGSPGQIALESDSSSGTVDFQDDILSTSGNVHGTIQVTNSSGGVTLDKVEVNGDLSVIAAGSIDGAGNSGGDARADHLSLYTTVDGASVGGENDPLRFDANTLSASTQGGHIVVSDTSGDLTLNRVTTGDNSAEAGLRALITAEDGNLRGSHGTEPNVEAWATNLKADGAIGEHGQAVTTAVDVLSAATQNGGIHVDEQDGELMLGKVVAGERVSLAGKTVSSTGISGADGSITLSTGAVGSHDIMISADDNILIGDQVSAPDELSIVSRQGGLYKNGDTAIITGRFIHLDAAGRIGQSSSALKTQSNAIRARSGGDGIYLFEDNGLTADDIRSLGENAEVQLEANLGDVALGLVEAENGDVTVVSQDGNILADGHTPINVRGDHLSLHADGAIGTAAQGLYTRIGSLTTSTDTSLAGTYVDNSGVLSSLDVSTLDGNVAVTDDNGDITFNRVNDHLAVQRHGGDGLDLTFQNGAGNLIVEGADLSGHQVNLSASGRIGDDGGVFAADDLTLNAGDDIELATDANTIAATTADGDIVLDNRGEGTLLLNATAGGANRRVSVSHRGDLSLGQVSGDGQVRLIAEGGLNGDGDSTSVIGGDVELDAARIGAADQALSTATTGTLSMLSDGDIYVTNVGALSLLEGEAGGDIDFSQAGDTVLGRLASGGSVTFYATGRVSDGNGDSDNIVAGDLNLQAQQVGAADGTVDALEIRVDELVVSASNGGIYLRNRNNGALSLVTARAAGGDVDIDTAGNMNLGTVTAAGGNVTLTSSDGAINDARPDGASEANVVARKVDMRAKQGIGNTGPMVLDVDQMSVSGGNGNVNAASPGTVEVEANSLVGKGASGVTIVAAAITVLDNNGGTLVMDGGKLVLTATNGNIVFLNQDDTISLPGGGSITLTARADTSNEGYNGSIIAGNLVTEGGDITLDADRNVTLGMLDTGGTGDVYVIARDGVILDGNGADQNVRGDHVTLIGNTPSERDAGIARETAIADYAGRAAELSAKILQLKTLQQQLEAYVAVLNSAIVNKNISQQNLKSAQRTVDRLSGQLSAAEKKLNSLNRVVSAAQLAVDAMAMVAGGAQAIPFSGDGGADGTFQGLSLVLSAAQLAVDEYDRNTFSPLADELNEAMNDLDVAKGYYQDALTNVASWTTMRNTTQVSRDMADQSVFKATVARDASQALRAQAIAAYDQDQDIAMSADNPLGIQANRLDMGTTSGRALNSGVYLNSTGNLGLGNIESDGEIRVADVAGNISVVGDVVSPSLISLDAGGAVYGIGGTRGGGGWVPEAGMLNAPAIAVRAEQGIANSEDSLYTDTGEIAIDAGTGDAFVINDNGGDELVLGTVDGLSGLTAAGDMGLVNNGDLRLKTQIVDTDVDTDSETHLIAQGGAIIDDNGVARNVTAGDLFFRADGQVELDTLADRVVEGTSSAGDILLREGDDLTLVDLKTGNGDIDVDAGGDLILMELAAGGESAAIRLDADGRIDDDQDNETAITGKRLELTAGGSIGATGTNEVRGLDTAVDVVTANAKGEINLHDQDDLDVEKVITTSGNVTLSSDGGNLSLGEVRTDGEDANITLVADGAIDALNEADDTPELNADQLALRAGAGIGSADLSLLIETGALEADAGLGGLYLRNQNRDLTVGGVTPNLGQPGLSGLDASGDLHLTAADGAIVYNEDVTQAGEGDMRLDSLGDQTLNADLDAAGDLTMGAGGALTVNSQYLSSGGNLDVDTGGAIIAQAGTEMRAGGFADLNAGAPISLLSTTVTSGAFLPIAPLGVSAPPENVDLGITSVSGDILITDNTQLNAAAGNLTLNAATGIQLDSESSGTASGDVVVNTATGDLSIIESSLTATGGKMDLYSGERISLADATATANTSLAMKAGTDIKADSSEVTAESDTLDLEAGSNIALTNSKVDAQTGLTATADQGSITLDDSSAEATTGNLAMTAGQRILLTKTDDGIDNLDAGSTLTAGSGNLALNAGSGIQLDSASSGTASGDVTANTSAGDLTIIEESSLAATDGQMDLDAGNGVEVTDSRLTAGDGMTVDAVEAGITLTRATATANTRLAMKAGTDIKADSSGMTATRGRMDLDAGEGISLADATATAGTHLAMKAGTDIKADSSEVTAESDTLDLEAASNIAFTNSKVDAETGLTATADQGSITLDDSSAEATTGNLAMTAGQRILLTKTDDGIDNLDAGSTLTAGSGNLALNAGSGIQLDSASSGTASGDVTANTSGGDLTIIEESSLAATDGQMDLDAGNGVEVTDSRLTAGDGMTVDAVEAGITLTRATATANTRLAMKAGTDIKADSSGMTATRGRMDLDAGEGISLADATATAGTHLAMKAGTDIKADSSEVTAESDTLDLEAGSNIALTNSKVNAQTGLTATADQGSITLDDSSAEAATGNLAMTAGQRILLTKTDDGIDNLDAGSTLTAGSGNLALNAGSGIQLDSASSGIASGSVAANTTVGDLTIIDESSLTATDGNMNLDAGNDVVVTNGSNATASGDMTMTAGQNVTVQNGSQATAKGGLTANAKAGDLKVDSGSGLTATEGNMNLDAGNDIVVISSSTATANGDMAMNAGQDVTVQYGSQATVKGDLTANAKTGDLKVDSGSGLTATEGNMNLDAGNDVVVISGSTAT
ncbi:filamentous hemagglutinin N-terminal domain-containing protein, partial [Halomonas icarae]